MDIWIADATDGAIWAQRRAGEVAAGPRNNAHSPQVHTTATQRALAYAIQRKHQYETLEHLLIDDVDASAVMKACKVDLSALREKVTNYIDNDLKTIVSTKAASPNSPLAFSAWLSARRTMQRGGAVLHGPAQSFF